jgi:uncharacterized membrane protein HdeD (DUF308 family)
VLHLSLALRGARRQERWGSLLFAGIAGIAAGVVTLVWPRISALALLFLIAAWAIVIGLASIFAAVRLRREIRNEWLLGISGALSIVFGVLLALFPGPGALALTIWIGAYALVIGALLVALGFRMRALRGAPQRRAPTGAVPTAA